MSSFQSLSGYPDLVGIQADQMRQLEKKAWAYSALAGFKPVYLPAVERLDLFSRTSGVFSDIVSKEMVALAQEDLCLRPEGTAGAVRAWLDKGATNLRQARWAYCAPMYRAERPQAGRQKEFRQFGLEGLGIPFGAFDPELVAFASGFLDLIGLQYELRINSIGTADERGKYTQALKLALLDNVKDFNEIERGRLERSPLRLWDKPSSAVAKALQEAPRLGSFLGAESQEQWEQFRGDLDVLGVAYTIDETLVRGLDYYNGPVFEWTAAGAGKELAIAAGGRYDGLCAEIGGTSSPAAGMAFGMERLLLALDNTPSEQERWGSQANWQKTEGRRAALLWAKGEREQGRTAWVDSKGGNWGKQTGRADSLLAQTAAFFGSSEIESGIVTLKNLESGTQDGARKP